MMIKSYCLIGLGDTEGIKEDITFVSESTANYVCGKGLLIATFTSSLHITEIEEFLNMNERSFIIFEMTPGFFSANIKDKKFQAALFGGKIDNSFMSTFKMDDNLREMMEELKEELTEDSNMIHKSVSIPVKEEPTLDQLLDKINEIGIKNLTKEDIKLLKTYST